MSFDTHENTPDAGDITEDLDADIDTLDRMGLSTNTDHEATTAMATAINRLSQSTAEIGGRLEEIHDEATSQYDANVEVANEASNLSASVEEIASSSEEVAAASEKAQDLAETGQESATDLSNAMEDIRSAADVVAEDVTAIRRSAEEIDKVVEVINDIADQTNILAINASIEAAGADANGDRFGVVASEVKSLAEDSQRRATEIEGMIEDDFAPNANPNV